MNAVVQTVITAFIVLAAVVYAVVLIRRRKRSGCTDCDGCPLVEKCTKPQNPHRQ